MVGACVIMATMLGINISIKCDSNILEILVKPLDIRPHTIRPNNIKARPNKAPGTGMSNKEIIVCPIICNATNSKKPINMQKPCLI